MAHGSPNAAWRDPIDAVVAELRTRDPDIDTRVAFLGNQEPAVAECIADCVRSGATEVQLLPYFLAPGRHSDVDVPELARIARETHPGVEIHGSSTPLGSTPAARAGLVAAALATPFGSDDNGT